MSYLSWMLGKITISNAVDQLDYDEFQIKHLLKRQRRTSSDSDESPAKKLKGRHDVLLIVDVA